MTEGAGPRKILMTADAVGGVWGYALDLARGLADRGTQVVLATMGPAPSPAQRAEANAIPGLALELGAFKLEWMDDPWRDVDAAGGWLLDLATRHAPDVVHLNGYAHAALPFRAPKVVVGHSCVVSWWWAVKGAPPPVDWLQYHRRTESGLQAADIVIAPTRWMLATLRRHYGSLPPALAIANGRDARDFPVGEKEALVLSAGRLWDDAKNVGVLARAAADLRWPVLVAGEAGLAAGAGGPLRARNVRLLGALPKQRLAVLYARASIYALPARYEPFGLSALEAGLAGCALVLGDIPSLRETWDGAALFVDPDDAAGLAAALAGLIHNPGARAAWAARARRRALRFPARRMCDRYAAVYGTLLRARAAGGQRGGLWAFAAEEAIP